MKSLTILSLSLGCLLAAPALAQTTYNVDQNATGGQFGAASTGQTFTPNVASVPAMPAGNVSLRQVTFYYGDRDAGVAPNTQTLTAVYLNIYTGNPLSATSSFVGSSTDSINAATLFASGVVGDALTWNFDLTLDSGTQYWAVISDSQTGVPATALGISFRNDNGIVPNPYAGGTGLTGNYTTHTRDLQFNLVFQDPPAPTPTSYTITQSTGGGQFGAASTGQTFTPNVGSLPAGMPAGNVPLRQVTFYYGDRDAGVATNTQTLTAVYLNIYNGIPGGAGSTFVGSSYDSIDAADLFVNGVLGDALTWNFANLALDSATTYYAVISDSKTGVPATALGISFVNDGGLNAYAGGSGLIASYGFHTRDLQFDMTFDLTGFSAYLPFGECPHSGGQAVLSSPSGPSIGQNFQVDMGPIPATSVPFFFFSFQDVTWTGLAQPLPKQLNTVVGWANPSCYVVVDPAVTFTGALGGTTASTGFLLPNAVYLIGLPLLYQGAQLEAGPALGLTGELKNVVGL